MVGHFTSTLDLGAGQKLQSLGGNDVAVVIFSADGDVRWADRLGGPGADYGYAVAAFAEGVAVGGMMEEHGFIAGYRLH
jgi:hypothetical protein